MCFPSVAIVGRVNVGKSTLFNRLTGRRIAIEDATPGVTRDRVASVCEFSGKFVELVDTGGEPVEEDPYAPDVRRQIAAAVEHSTLVLMVVDVKDGCVPLDGQIAKALAQSGRESLLVVNKVDSETQAPLAAEFARLGFAQTLCVSGTTGRGLADLVARIAHHALTVPSHARPARSMRIAIIGRVNSGKSTWVNAALGEERMIVSDRPGTTRDAVDVHVLRGKREFVLVDTAGVRKPRSVDGSIEFYAQQRALAAARSADAVLLLIDAATRITETDKKLAGLVAGESTPAVVVLNKWDRIPPDKGDAFVSYAAKKLRALGECPVAFTSGLARTNLWETLELAWELASNAKIWWDPALLRQAVEAAFQKHPPRSERGGKTVSLNGVRQTGISPVRIQIHTNQPEAFAADRLRMFAAAIRKHSPWEEIPILVEAIGPSRKKRASRHTP